MKKIFLNMLQDLYILGMKKFGKNLVVIHEKKEFLTLNKPEYVGSTVLELSKLAMYKFYYDFVKKKCRNSVLLFTNTDSSCFKLKKIFMK